jgi:hypothetical protein
MRLLKKVGLFAALFSLWLACNVAFFQWDRVEAERLGMYVTENDGSPAGFAYKIIYPNNSVSLTAGEATFVGPSYLGGDATFTGSVGIGRVPTQKLDIYEDVAGDLRMEIENPSTGVDAFAALSVKSDVAEVFYSAL